MNKITKIATATLLALSVAGVANAANVGAVKSVKVNRASITKAIKAGKLNKADLSKFMQSSLRLREISTTLNNMKISTAGSEAVYKGLATGAFVESHGNSCLEGLKPSATVSEEKSELAIEHLTGAVGVMADNLIENNTVVDAEKQKSSKLKAAASVGVTYLSKVMQISREAAVEKLAKIAQPGTTCAIPSKLGTAL